MLARQRQRVKTMTRASNHTPLAWRPSIPICVMPFQEHNVSSPRKGGV